MNGGTLEVLSGGRVTNVLYENGPTIQVIGGTIDTVRKATDNYNWIDLQISENGVVRNGNFSWSGQVVILNGGKLEDSTISDFSLTVSSGGQIQSIRNNGWADISVLDSGIAVDTELRGDRANMFVQKGGIASRALIAEGTMTLSGGISIETDIYNGTLYVSSGGTATKTKMTGERYQDWTGSSWAWSNRYGFGGAMHISEGGLGVDTQIIRSIQTVSRGGVASKTEISSRGSQVISNGGVASETTLTNGGRLIVSRGGVAQDVVRSGDNGPQRLGGMGADRSRMSRSGGMEDEIERAGTPPWAGGVVRLERPRGGRAGEPGAQGRLGSTGENDVDRQSVRLRH
jgi:autotransporter passenger strand-loop-strand repeat protein